MKRLLHGVGINDADYKTCVTLRTDGIKKTLWKCPYYERWSNMLQRCYFKKYQEAVPTYKGCVVCDEWLTFSNFKKWMEQQDWEGKHLDKDFLGNGSKIYNPSTCVFVPPEVNGFLVVGKKTGRSLPLGVKITKHNKKNPYLVRSGKRDTMHIGYFSDPQDAHQAWLKYRLTICEGYLIKYKDDNVAVKCLLKVKDILVDHIENKKELLTF